MSIQDDKTIGRIDGELLENPSGYKALIDCTIREAGAMADRLLTLAIEQATVGARDSAGRNVSKVTIKRAEALRRLAKCAGKIKRVHCQNSEVA